MASAEVTVYEVLYVVDDDSPGAHGGAAGDGSFIYRTRDKRDAEHFAEGRWSYSGPAKVRSTSVPRRIARRWGLA